MSKSKLLPKILFWTGASVIGWGMVGYKESLKILEKKYKNRKLHKNSDYKPTVTVMIVAHNEEKVIQEKLDNVIDNDYPTDRIDYIVASDWSTDRTNDIVNDFIESHQDIKMSLYCSKEHLGKTNAQNEAQKHTTGEILVMSDANAMFERNSISELVSCFTSENIAYVCGRLKYMNDGENDTASSESTYWESDLRQREIESNIYTITAGNGAIYACRNNLYYDFPPINCHDSSMPLKYGVEGKRALYNPDAIAYEKAGETNKDEYKRKVRMNRNILEVFPISAKMLLTTPKHPWFSYFYFGHRTCRYLLWLAHGTVLATSAILAPTSVLYALAFGGQAVFYGLAAYDLKKKPKNKAINMVGYYTMTIVAQAKAAYLQVAGKSKSTWDSAKTTR